MCVCACFIVKTLLLFRSPPWCEQHVFCCSGDLYPAVIAACPSVRGYVGVWGDSVSWPRRCRTNKFASPVRYVRNKTQQRYHPKEEHFGITARPVVFYSSYTTASVYSSIYPFIVMSNVVERPWNRFSFTSKQQHPPPPPPNPALFKSIKNKKPQKESLPLFSAAYNWSLCQ